MIERIDALLVGVKPQREWGSLVVVYLFLGGAGAGLYAVSLYMERPFEAILGLAAVAVGALFLLLDLGRPERFWRAFLRPGTSWISRGTFFIALLLLFGAAQAAPSFPGLGFLPWGEGTTAGWMLKGTSALLAVLVMTYTGFVLSPSPAIPFWNSPLVPAVFLSYSMLAGVDLFLLLERAFGRAGGNLMVLERFQGHLTALCLAIVVLHVAVMSARTVAARETVKDPDPGFPRRSLRRRSPPCGPGRPADPDRRAAAGPGCGGCGPHPGPGRGPAVVGGLPVPVPDGANGLLRLDHLAPLLENPR